jgi:asparagine synthase (glutamine-hydrolysing)
MYLLLEDKVIKEKLQICTELKALLTESVARNYSDNLLLSGGLDSSIVSSILHPKKTITVASSIKAPDLYYARLIAHMYSKQHNEFILSLNELFQVIENVIYILKTFDPIEIRNSSVAFAAIDLVRKEGQKSIMTGDGADELFAGYNYLLRYFDDHVRLDDELARLWDLMSFSSIKIGKKLGIRVFTPFLDKQFMRFAKSLNVDTKLGLRNGKKWGKFILRECFESDLGANIVWRRKYAQEEGSGFTTVRNILLQGCKSDALADGEGGRDSGVHIRDMEHLYYFHIYRKYFPPPVEEACAGERCPDCCACLSDNSNYCHTCGCFPTKVLLE